ncbi:MAG TPA: hypothetical protein VEI24_00185, partial [Nitrospiria bacterium]|nr:hypothetical protein [Nitrospiria bacterium]
MRLPGSAERVERSQTGCYNGRIVASLPPLSRINSDPAGSELIDALRARLGAMKVLSDQPARKAYSADASIYTLTPRAVVLAESADDVA